MLLSINTMVTQSVFELDEIDGNINNHYSSIIYLLTELR